LKFELAITIWQDNQVGQYFRSDRAALTVLLFGGWSGAMGWLLERGSWFDGFREEDSLKVGARLGATLRSIWVFGS